MHAGGADVRTHPPSPQPWSILADGALPLACQALETASEAPIKYHAITLLSVSLQQTRKALEVCSQHRSPCCGVELWLDQP